MQPFVAFNATTNPYPPPSLVIGIITYLSLPSPRSSCIPPFMHPSLLAPLPSLTPSSTQTHTIHSQYLITLRQLPFHDLSLPLPLVPLITPTFFVYVCVFGSLHDSDVPE